MDGGYGCVHTVFRLIMKLCLTFINDHADIRLPFDYINSIMLLNGSFHIGRVIGPRSDRLGRDKPYWPKAWRSRKKQGLGGSNSV